MAQVLIREQGLEWTTQCPNCSHSYVISKESEKDGKIINIPDTSKAPENCGHCGCPMDPAKQRSFGDAAAVRDHVHVYNEDKECKCGVVEGKTPKTAATQVGVQIAEVVKAGPGPDDDDGDGDGDDDC